MRSRLFLKKTWRIMRIPARTVVEAPPVVEPSTLITEDGDDLLTEAGDTLTTEF